MLHYLHLFFSLYRRREGEKKEEREVWNEQGYHLLAMPLMFIDYGYSGKTVILHTARVSGNGNKSR
jgi:hypothetical protein